MIDIELVVDKLAEFGYIRKHKISGSYYTIYCPFHKDGNERRPSCGVLLHDEFKNGQKYPAGLFHCFTCGSAYTLVDGISKILESKHVSKSSIDWLTENIPDFNADYEQDTLIPADLVKILNARYAVTNLSQMLDPAPEYVSEEELARYRFTVPYMYERKLTDKIIEDYDIGFDQNWVPEGHKKPIPCITFPVRDIQGHTLFICRRSVEGKFFNYPKHVTKPVYGIEMIPKGCRSVVICESCINALTVVSYGYPAVALLGTGNPYQMQQLRELGVAEFVLCMDGDEAGERAVRRLKSNLSSVALLWTIHMPAGKDANDCTKEEFDKLYKARD